MPLTVGPFKYTAVVKHRNHDKECSSPFIFTINSDASYNDVSFKYRGFWWFLCGILNCIKKIKELELSNKTLKLMDKTMYKNLTDFCEEYNLPIEHLGSVLKDPKVIPMIRGKAFEFSACDYLKQILDETVWKVSKPFLNAQANSLDEDVLIEHLPTSSRIRIECKMSGKGDYYYANGVSKFKIKCMRSRTLGASKVDSLAISRQLNEDGKKQLSTHNDNYLPGDFDLVLTTLANAFYETDGNGVFIWKPTEDGQKYLESKFGVGLTDKDYQNKAFYDMYFAKSTDLTVRTGNGFECVRRKCTDKDNCGYIPNYPLLTFNHEDLNTPTNKWVHITNIENVLTDFIA